MKPTTIRSYYPSLDGLRGIAILVVIIHHAFAFLPFAIYGYLGVDLFFVLSGFLITDILIRTREEKNFIRNFFIRRILRIFPLYYAMLLLFFFLAPFVSQLHAQYNYYHDNQGMVWFHLTNWLYIFNYRPPHTMLFSHFWSLSVEEQFYILWPFLVLFCRNLQRLKLVIYGILIICIGARFSSWLYWGGDHTSYVFQFMTRVDGLCVGSLIAIWKFANTGNLVKKFLYFFIPIICIECCLFILSRTIFIGLPHFIFTGYTSIAAIFGLAVLSASSKTMNFGKPILENKVLKYFGKISYGLYIFHWPVYLFVRFFLEGTLVKNGMYLTTAKLITGMTTLVLATLISTLSYTIFERRILAFKDVMTESGYFTKLRQRLVLLIRPASTK